MPVVVVADHAVMWLLERVVLEVVVLDQMQTVPLQRPEVQIPAVVVVAAAELLVVAEAVLQDQEVQALSSSNTPYLALQT
jgi:hypothetical protein